MLLWNAIACLTGNIILCLVSMKYGFGFFIGVITSFSSFYCLKNALGAEFQRIEREMTMARCLLALTGRMAIASGIILAGLLMRANPMGMVSGITYALIVEVLVLYRAQKKMVSMNIQ